MKFLIASDIHGSAHFARQLASRYEAEGASRLLLLGDLLYHGPRNALPEEYYPAGVAAILNELKDDILAVKGNCDSAVDQAVLSFPIEAPYAVIFDGEATLYLSHGDIFTPEAPLPHKKGDVLLTGHTHVPHVIRKDMLFLNPGSVSIPKGDSDHSYLVYESGLFTFKKMDGTVYNQVPLFE